MDSVFRFLQEDGARWPWMVRKGYEEQQQPYSSRRSVGSQLKPAVNHEFNLPSLRIGSADSNIIKAWNVLL